jgi:hypothetical protein
MSPYLYTFIGVGMIVGVPLTGMLFAPKIEVWLDKQ